MISTAFSKGSAIRRSSARGQIASEEVVEVGCPGHVVGEDDEQVARFREIPELVGVPDVRAGVPDVEHGIGVDLEPIALIFASPHPDHGCGEKCLVQVAEEAVAVLEGVEETGEIAGGADQAPRSTHGAHGVGIVGGVVPEASVSQVVSVRSGHVLVGEGGLGHSGHVEDVLLRYSGKLVFDTRSMMVASRSKESLE